MDAVNTSVASYDILIDLTQCIITLPWRIYTYKVSKGVLGAIHCVEELQFQASYKADALRNLLPDTVSYCD